MNRQVLSLFVFVFLTACFSGRDLSTTNMVSYYRATDNVLHPEITYHNTVDSSTVLYVKVHPDEFLYVRQPDESFKSFIRIYAELVESYESLRAMDSSSAEFSFEMADKAKTKLLKMVLPVHSSGNFLIHLTIFDKNRNSSEDFFIPYDNSAAVTAGDFLITGMNDQPLFRTFVSATDTFRLKSKKESDDSVLCRYYNRSFDLAAPPFSFDMHAEFNYHPDSIFKLPLRSDQGIVLAAEGFYLISNDTSVYSGATIFRFSPGFPSVVYPAQMADALRYLISKKEYDELKSATNLKKAVDEFWLARGGSEEKTRALIKRYYGRVQEANRLFTSYTEGWRTDRGMIFVIFGMPTTIYKSSNSESWIYGTQGSPLSINFFFTRVNNPFTTNDYTLSRTPIYEANWYRAVETWRQGRVYNSFN